MTELIRGFANIKEKHQNAVITIGNFDGVHLGHKTLIAEVKRTAKEKQTASLMMIFEPQPQEFFTPEKSVARLTRFREKYDELMQTGIDYILVLRFNAALAALSADDFIENLLKHQLKIKEIIVGDDFHFGHKRSGNVDWLKKKSQGAYAVTIMPSVTFHDKRISSTRIRKALHDADHELVQELLGRPYSMMGRVVYGNQLGRVLGFPTANIYLHRLQTPVLGIYIVRVHGIHEKPLPGVANVGIRPTIGGTRTLLEVYLFDFNQSIYGKYVKVEFCKKIREEERFANLDLLKEAMQQDAIAARQYFVTRGELILKSESGHERI